MGSQTTNYDFNKPAKTDNVMIGELNENMDILDGLLTSIDEKDNKHERSIAIVSDGNTHIAIGSGQFVYVRGHNTLTEGLYKATADISENGTLSLSNLTASSSGGLNAVRTEAVIKNRDLVNNLLETGTGKALDARQGKALADTIAETASKMVTSGSCPEIPSNSDLNNYRTPGVYIVPTDSIGSTISNIPRAASGKLVVIYRTYYTYITQFYIPTTSTNIVYLRNYNDGTWTNWDILWSGTDGTWTPNVQRATVTSAFGRYQRIGNLYICSFYFEISAVESSAPYINGTSLPGYTSSVIWAIEGNWSSSSDEFGSCGNTNNNNVWFAKSGVMYGLSGSVGKAVRGVLTYIV